MPRSPPFWIAICITSLRLSEGWAEEPPCPSQATAPPAGPAQTPTPGTAGGGKSIAESGNIDITSDQALLGVDGNATLQGNVDIHQGDREIKANEVQYNEKTNDIRTEGGIDYTDPVVHVTGEGGSYRANQGADFNSAQFELRQRAARGAARKMELTPQGVIRLEGVTFSTCPASDEVWKLKADRITLDTRTKVGTGRATRIDFKGVPLLYLPWVSFPLGAERKSGFLFPVIGNTSNSGAQFSIPYYWNIAPNADFTFQPVEYSRRGTDVGGDFRYLTRGSHGELDWSYLPYDATFHRSRSRVRLTNVAELPGDLRFSVNAENVSDTQYFEDFAQGPEGTSTAFVQRRAALSYRDEHWRLDAEAQQYQTIDSTLALTERPYARVPRLAANADYGWGPDQLLRYGFDSEAVKFDRSTGTTGWRIDVLPGASLDFDGAGYFMHPSVGWRVTQYELNNTPGGNRSPTRTLPVASFDTGLLFDRPTGSRGQRTLTLEPRLLYLYVPYRNQDNLPIFDTALPDLINPVELFRNNRYVGADRVADADQLSAGVTSRLLDAHSGRQFIAATVGQIYYFKTPRVTLPGEAVRTGNSSDFVAQLALTAFQDWNADFGLQWNPQASRNQRTYVNVQYKPARDAVVNVGYRFERDTLEQAEISSAWPISRTWNAFLREIYSLRDAKPVESFAGFEYRACCWGVRFGGRRFVSTRNGSQSTGVFLELELTGLASVGSASDALLSENIRGYAPADQKLRGP